MIREAWNIQLLKFTGFHNISNCIYRLALTLKLFYVRNNLIPILCTNNEVYPGNIQNFSRRCLCITPCNGNNCIRIAAHSPANNLTAFLISGICNRTSINQINVGCLFKINLLIAFVFKQLPNRFCIIKIHFTTYSVKCNGWHL
ncbi:hypothetical protein D3C73_813780 [compost metagenome]